MTGNATEEQLRKAQQQQQKSHRSNFKVARSPYNHFALFFTSLFPLLFGNLHPIPSLLTQETTPYKSSSHSFCYTMLSLLQLGLLRPFACFRQELNIYWYYYNKSSSLTSSPPLQHVPRLHRQSDFVALVATVSLSLLLLNRLCLDVIHEYI